MKLKNYFLFALMILIISMCVTCVAANDNLTDEAPLTGSADLPDMQHANQSTFKDLNNVINSSSNYISLSENYTYSADVDGDFKGGILIDRQITIDGNGYVIDGNNKAAIFKVSSDNVVLKNINFINSNSEAIVWEGVNGTIFNCNFTNNSDSMRGIIAWEGGFGSIVGCNFIDNSAKCFGSAIYWNSNNGKLINSNFLNNFASNKGTVFWRGNNASIHNCSFINNGNFVYCLKQAKVVLDYEDDCTQVNPYSNPLIRDLYFYYGGAVYYEGNDASISNCHFINNSAYEGGAIYFIGNLSCVNLVFLNNSCVNKGGAIYCKNSQYLSITNSTFINNSPQYLFNNSEMSILELDNIIFDYWYDITGNSFNALSNLINITPEASTLTLDKDYEYTNGTNKGILINKSITIDGAGHTLNGNRLSRMFNITADNVTIRNINFVNGNAFGRYGGIAGGGAIYLCGDNGFIENCTFTNNTGYGIEDDPYDKEETVVTEDGTIIHWINVRPMGSKTNEGGAIVWNGTNGTVSKCIFTNNAVGYANAGGAICWRGDNGTVTGSQFYRNDALCGSAIAWIGDNGKIFSTTIANSTFYDGGLYWFGHNGTVRNSILLNSAYKSSFGPSDADVDVDYNFWGDTIEHPNQEIKSDNVNNWLVMKFTHNGEFVKKGQKILIEYDITTLIGKNGKISTYDALVNKSGQFEYIVPKSGFLDIRLINGNINVSIDTKEVIKSGNLNKYYSKKTSFSVKVYDMFGLIVGKKVKFTINAKDYFATTNKNGIATLKINLKPGTYTVYSSYGKVIVKNKITIKKTLITKNVSKKVKKTGKFTVKVLNSKGKAYAKQTVKIKFKGKTYKIKTNKKGIATFKIPKNLKVGKYVIKTTYNGLTVSNKIVVKK